MRLLRLAVEIQRWDLAAHTIVLAAATTLKNGDKPDVKSKSKEKKGAPQRATKTLSGCLLKAKQDVTLGIQGNTDTSKA